MNDALYSSPECDSHPRWHDGRALLAVALAIGAALLIPFLDTVPGLQGDEAWAGLRAHTLANGELSFYGMNVYTGPIHQWLLLPLLETLGYHVWSLRLLTVLTSLLSVWLLFLIVRRLFDALLGGLAALLLVSMPWFTLYGRTATENFALNPVLALAASWCLLKAMDGKHWARDSLAGASGALLALGTWNHLIFSPVPLVLALAALKYAPARSGRSRVAAMVLLGFVAAGLPRMIALLAAPDMTQSGLRSLIAATVPGLSTRLLEWPGVFPALLHGDLLYQRYAGEVVWPTPPVITALLAVAMGGIVHQALRHTDHKSQRLKRILVGFCLFAFLTMLIAPGNSDRYFLLMLYFGAFFLALTFRMFFSIVPSKVVGPVTLAAFVLFNVTRTVINFHSAHIASGGKTSMFLIGSQVETSNALVRTDRLYQHLAREPVDEIYGEFFIVLPLQFYDLNYHRFRRIERIDTGSPLPHDAKRSSSILVSYLGGYNRIRPEDFGATELWTFQHFVINGFTLA
jgi:4-amino-4-deoxy-L-arabinose transferase-like glycosyltransferase